jgi:hypothetical protein
VTWPPAQPEQRLVGTPWQPASISGVGVTSDFGYAVVEEIDGDDVRTVVSQWPMLTDDGRLRFGDPEEAREYVDTRAEIEALLASQRIVRVPDAPGAPPPGMNTRRLDIGDVFAIPGPPAGGGGGGGGGGGNGGGGRLTDLIGHRSVYDITAEARLAAQAAHSAAIAGTLSHEDVERFLDVGEAEDEPPEPTGGSSVPSGTGSPPSTDPAGAEIEETPSLTEAVAAYEAESATETQDKQMEAGA